MQTPKRDHLILLTGATGYVGARLLSRLEADCRRVRCLARHPESLLSRVSPGAQVVAGDILEPESLGRALQGGAHRLLSYTFIERRQRLRKQRCNRRFAQAATKHGVSRIIYLGSLGEAASGLSKRLRSRQEVGDILRESGIPVTPVPRVHHYRSRQSFLRIGPSPR